MFEKTETGMPQGGPLSPPLSNIMSGLCIEICRKWNFMRLWRYRGIWTPCISEKLLSININLIKLDGLCHHYQEGNVW